MTHTQQVGHRRSNLLSVRLTADEWEQLTAIATRAGFTARSQWVRLVLHQALAGRGFSWATHIAKPARKALGDGAALATETIYRFRVDDSEVDAIQILLHEASSGSDVWTPSEYLTALVRAAMHSSELIVGWVPEALTA